MNRLTLVLLLVATAAIASLVTLALAPSSALRAQGLVTRKVSDKPVATPAPVVHQISAYAFVEPPRTKRGEPSYTLGFFALNPTNGKVANCQYMWAGLPINKCVNYPWVKLP